jgi:hypothetical protein
MITDWAREGGISGFDIECDKCGQAENFDRTYFRDFIADAKSEGWKMVRDEAGDWTHLCPTCVKGGD